MIDLDKVVLLKAHVDVVGFAFGLGDFDGSGSRQRLVLEAGEALADDIGDAGKCFGKPDHGGGKLVELAGVVRFELFPTDNEFGTRLVVELG